MAGRPGRGAKRAVDGARAAAAGAGSAAASAASLGWQATKSVAGAVAWLAGRAELQRLFAGGALATCVVLATHEVRARVESWPRFELDRSSLRTTPLPPTLSQRARQDLERLPLPERPSAFDAQLVPCAAAGLERLPWVRSVEAVRLEAPARLTFSVVAREPVARLERDDDGALTRDVAVIPLAYVADPDALPRITGVPGPGALAARRRALEAAVRVLDELGPELLREVRAIDLTNLDGKADPLASEVVLLLDGDLPVEWGRAPDAPAPPGAPGSPGADPAPGRPTIDGEQKRAALRAFLKVGPSRATLARVSVRWDETTYVQKPAADGTGTPTSVAASTPRGTK